MPVSILVPRVGPPRRISQLNVVAGEFPQTQALGEGDRKDQPGIGHQACPTTVEEPTGLRSPKFPYPPAIATVNLAGEANRCPDSRHLVDDRFDGIGYHTSSRDECPGGPKGA